MLTTAELNRTLLLRQGLLKRSARPPLEAVAALGGLQAQVPANPYVALWARSEGFAPESLSALLEERALVRAPLMRGTVHLATAADALAWQPATVSIMRRIFRSNFAKLLPGVDVEAVVQAGRELLDAGAPLAKAELAEALGPRFPGADAASLAQAVGHHLLLVQATPRGLWGRSGQARWVPTETWLGAPAGEPDVEGMVRRYLSAFGPASPADVRTWCNLTGLRAVLDGMDLARVRDAEGRELLDVPGAPLADGDVPAPVRFLPEYDNVLLSHADRTRIVGPGAPPRPWPTGTWIGTLLADGWFRAWWKADGDTLAVIGWRDAPGDPRGLRDEIVAEGERLLAFLGLDARVTFSGRDAR